MLVVQGEPASLDDAVESADIKASVAIGDSPEPGKFDTWQGEYALPPVSCHYPDLYVVRNQSGSVQARVGTTPNCKVELRGGYEIELRISQRERFFKLTLTANTTGGLGVEGKVNAAAKFQKSVPLLKDWAQVNMISLLGIPIKVSANFEAQLEAAFDGAAQVRVSRSITNKTVVFMQFNNGAWTSGKEDQPNATQIDDDLQLNLGGKANVTAGLESKFSVGFGGHAFGAGLQVDAGVEMLNQLKLAADGKLDVVNPGASQMTYGVDACADVDLYASTGFHSFIYKKEREWKHDLYANCWDLVDGKLPLK
ncbi:MAG: hypothetical protein MUF54_16200 [Polyangiaceae bacterium]|jgi:hypothetical protein|nr:hypothetical protein [Polyangiaceae bacterium]